MLQKQRCLSDVIKVTSC